MSTNTNEQNYTYDEVYKNSLKYFHNNELSANVYISKYALQNRSGEFVEKSPEDTLIRVAKELFRIEKNKFKSPIPYEQIMQYLDKFQRIIPQGSPLYGIGNPYQYVSLSNCYVVESPYDSYGGIMKADQDIVQISKRRGGVGLDVSNLRPIGTETTNAAKSSTGIQSFSERFSNSIREVGQSGRRGALIITISVHHPEISNFIKMKQDKTKVTGANISIRLTDEFLNAVKKDKDYELRWPVDSKNPVISQKVSAREIWDSIIEQNYEDAEPGLLFWDRIIENSPADSYSKLGYATTSTNPCCFAKKNDVYVVTQKGLKEIKNITKDDLIWIDTDQTWANTSGYFDAGTSPTKIISLNNGLKFIVSNNHKFYIERNSETIIETAENLRKSDRILLHTSDVDYNETSEYDDMFFLLGLFLGQMLYAKDNNEKYMVINYQNNASLFHKVENILKKCDIEYKKDNDECLVDCNTFCNYLLKYYNIDFENFGSIKKCLFSQNRNNIQSFLVGSFKKSHSAETGMFSSVYQDIIDLVRQLLILFGIQSDVSEDYAYVPRKQAWKQKLEKKVYYTLNTINMKLEDDCISSTGLETDTVGIHSIQDGVEEKIGCIDVNNYHLFTANGIVSGNSELPLCPYDSCRLLVLNLYHYINEPFKENAHFDFERFSRDAEVAQRFMDDIVDLEEEALDKIIKKIQKDPEPEDIKRNELELWKKIKETCVQGRRTGTGITALGDALAACGVKYGSQDAIKLTGEIYKKLKLSCYRSSVHMAKELGPFPIWDKKLEKDNKFLLRIKDEDPELWNDMQKYGRRNIGLLTTAPAGSLSILAQTSSGFEPVFSISGKRRKKVNPNDKNIRVDFVDDTGDAWQEFETYHPKIYDWMKITGKENIEESPWFGATAHDIDWQARVKMQAEAQKHVDHSISATCNLPSDISVDEIKKIYETAWESGCKGMTIYRDGSRSGVLLTEQDMRRSDKIIKTHAPKRPKKLHCDIHHMTVKGEPYFAIVGLLNDDPYEVFGGRNGNLIKNKKEGSVIKIKRGEYKLDADSGDEIMNISENINEEQECITRLLSWGLRHGADISFAVQQLEKTKGDLTSFGKVMSRCLKKYIKDGTKVTGEKCGKCGAESLVRQEGCVSCQACGWQKCS